LELQAYKLRQKSELGVYRRGGERLRRLLTVKKEKKTPKIERGSSRKKAHCIREKERKKPLIERNGNGRYPKQPAEIGKKQDSQKLRARKGGKPKNSLRQGDIIQLKHTHKTPTHKTEAEPKPTIKKRGGGGNQF